MGENLSLLIALSAGFLTFLSPCILPLVPIYIANLAGMAVAGSSSHRVTLYHSFSFVAGFSLVFVALGAGLGLAGGLLASYTELLRKMAGGLLVLFGLHLVGILRVPWLDYEKRLSYAGGNRPSYLRSLLIGATFSLGWTPCVGPILGSILVLAWDSQTMGQGIYLLAAYSLGLGLPFILVGLALGSATKYLKRLNRHFRSVSLVSGLLLIIIGALVFTGTLVKLNQYLAF